MPTFEFTLPDGRVASVVAPEGATMAQAVQMAQRNLGDTHAPAGASAAQQSSAPVPAAGGRATDLAGPTLQFGPWDTHVPIPEVLGSNLTRAGKVVADAGDKMKLLYLLATKGSDAPETQAHTAQTNAEQENYDASRAAQQAAANKKFGRAPDDSGWGAIPQALSNPAAMAYLLEGGGPDTAQAAANVAMTGPAIAAVPARLAATAMGRILTGGGVSGLTSLFTQPNKEGTALDVAKDAGISAVAGAGLQGGFEVGSKVLTTVAAKAAQLAKAISTRLGGGATNDAIAADVAAKVPNFAQMTDVQQAHVIDQARTAARSGLSYDPAAVGNRAEARSIGVNTTEGMDTRDPHQWYAEQELQKLDKAGGPDMNRQLNEVNAQLRGQLPQMRSQVQSTAATPYEAAEAAREGVQGFAKGAQNTVSAKYDAAAASPGAEQVIDGKTFFDKIEQHLKDYEQDIPTGVKTRLSELQAGLGAPTKAMKARAPLGVDVQNDSISMAVRKLGGINPDDDAVGSIAKSILFSPDPRNGGVWRKPTFGQSGRTVTGHSPDEMAGKLAQHGYGERNQLREDLLDKLADESNGAGGLHFSNFREVRAESPEVQALQDLVKELRVRNNPVSASPRDFTVGEAAKLRKLIGDTMNGPGSKGHAGKLLQQALDETAQGTAGAAGDAAKLYGDAVSTAKKRFQTLEPTPIAALNDVKEAAPNYIQTKILGGKPREVAALRDVLQKSNPGAWEDIRGQVIEHLQGVATMRDAAGKWSGARFNKALDDIGMDRLKVIFSPEELAQLGTIRRVGMRATIDPPFSNVNHSNSGSTLYNLLQNQGGQLGLMGSILNKVPKVGPILNGAAGFGKGMANNMALKSAGQEAMNPTHATPPLDAEGMRQMLAKLLLRAGAPAGAGSGRITSGP